MPKDTKKTKKVNPLLDEELNNEEANTPEMEEEEVKLVKPVKTSKAGINNIEAEVRGDHKLVKDALKKETVVRILIPLVGSEKKGVSQESVTINGYRVTIPKGIYVDVPSSIADIIERHYNTTPESTEVGEQFDLSRNKVKDGSSTDDALL